MTTATKKKSNDGRNGQELQVIQTNNGNKDNEARVTKDLEEMSSDTDDDDYDLMQAAGQWAQAQQTDNEAPSKGRLGTNEHQRQGAAAQQNSNTSTTRHTWSLHITQLSYEATDFDIREAFSKQGCMIQSIRLVYDYSSSSQKTFRGVAFIDLSDEDSYKRGLKLHKAMHMGRRINVRPTRTKTELANIVQRTQELVAAAKLKQQQNFVGKQTKDGPNKEPKDQSFLSKKRKRNDKKKESKKNKKEGEGDSTKESTKDNVDTKQKDKSNIDKTQSISPSKRQSSGSKKSEATHKLSKKERNRRAAIIMSKRQGRRGGGKYQQSFLPAR